MCLVTQSCPTLCNPMDCSQPGSSDHGILQARILEWVAMPSSGNIPNPGIEPRSPALWVDSLPAEPHKGSPRILEWVVYPFPRGSSSYQGNGILLQMALFHCFLWLSTIPLCIHTTSSLSIHLLMDT